MTQFKDMKIRIKDAEHCKAVIKCLEKLGYISWCGNNTDYLHQVDGVYAYYDKDYVLSRNGGSVCFEREESTEVTLEQLQEMLAEQSAKQEPVATFNPESTIDTYIHQLQQLLRDSKTSLSIFKDGFILYNEDNDDQTAVEDWDGVLEAIKAKQNYLSVFGK